jgi:D-glycero-alpha-D-manno-heptose-7-phosphate kinase
MIVRSRSPVRICDVGGWTDTRFAKTGAVCNIAVTLFSHCLVRDRVSAEEAGEPEAGRSAVIRALDLNQGVDIADVRAIEYDGSLDLLKAAVKRMEMPGGFEASIWADAPPGSGVGTSSAVSVALIAALGHFTDRRLPPHAVARLAHELETEELGLECGVQDQYAAAFGGVCFMEIDYPRVALSRLPVSPTFLWELEERLVLVYVGQSRLSDSVHRRVIERYEAGAPEAVGAMEALRQAAHAMKDAMLRADAGAVAEAINANWAAQKQLHADISNEAIERVFEVGTKAGAVAGKANGAGGGGTVTFLAAPGAELSLHQALQSVPDCTVLPCQICSEGVRSWVVSP